MSKKVELILAASIFVDDNMEEDLLSWPDHTSVYLEAVGREGYLKMFTLGELRRFWQAFRRMKE